MDGDPPTSKGRAARIRDYSYFKRRDPLSRWTLGLSVFAGAAGVVLVLVVTFRPSSAAPAGSPGRLSSAHAAWETRCDACLERWAPRSRGRRGAPLLGRAPRAPADRCSACHGGTDHFAGQSRDANNCASCHPEHRGHGARLTRPPDAACLACHAAPAGRHPAVTDFATDHPPFASPPRFSRQLKFSHAVHLAPGLALAGDGQPRRLTWADVPAAATQARRAHASEAADPKAPVRLGCAACHQLQSGDAAGGPAPDRADGRYYAPVQFEDHCRGCHSLTKFDTQMPELTAPHGGGTAELRGFLRRAFAAEFLDARPGLLDFTPGAPRLDRPAPPDPTAKAVLGARVATAERTLLRSGKGCAQCHLPGAGDDLLPVKAKQVWLEGATFSHRAHRAAECRVCHAGVYATPGPGATLAELEPHSVGGIEDCRRCHAPAAETGGVPSGGAGRACAECHTYHGHGGGRHRGPAAPVRDPHPRLDLRGFLGGLPPAGP